MLRQLNERVNSKILIAFYTLACMVLGIGAAVFGSKGQPKVELSNPQVWTSSTTLAFHIEDAAMRWHPELFLESYGITYEIVGTDPLEVAFSDSASFRFGGWRDDLWGRFLARSGTNWAVARITINAESRQITDVSYFNGEPYGYDVPLDVTDWPANDLDLLALCEVNGAAEYRRARDIEMVRVYAATARPGREWMATYSTGTQSRFQCHAEIDTGELKVRYDSEDWQIIGNVDDAIDN